MKKVLCGFCMELVDYDIKEKPAIKTIRDKDYYYNELITFCKECHKEINVSEILDKNIERIDEAYRKEENIISIDDINKILDKYDIGKKPLSSLLGWGETTIIRYLDGDMPSKTYSNVLKDLLVNPLSMSRWVENGKDRITDNAYRKVKKVLNGIFKVSNDIDIIIEYILNGFDEITPLALQKLLYYCQGFYIAFFGDYLFNDDCQAWVRGPVYPDVYEKYKPYGCSPIEQLDFEDIEFLDEEKKVFLDVIMKFFGYYSGDALAKMTHLETPWLNSRKGIPDNERSIELIDKKSIESYFTQIKNKYNMINITDISKYSEEHFNKIR